MRHATRMALLLASAAAASAAGCASGKEIKLEMNREVVLSQPAIQSLSLAPSGRVDTAGGPASVTVRMEGDERLKATFEVPGLVTPARAMREDAPGVYIGQFEVRQGISGHVPVIVELLHEPSGAQRRASVKDGLELFVGTAAPGAPEDGAGTAMASDGSGCAGSVIEELRSALSALTVHFEFNKADLTADEKRRLSEAAGIFRSHPGCAIAVHGHADEVGYEGYNLQLSMRRALEVATFLESMGIPGERIQRRWHGESQPVVAGGNEVSRAKNRRVEFEAVPLH